MAKSGGDVSHQRKGKRKENKMKKIGVKRLAAALSGIARVAAKSSVSAKTINESGGGVENRLA
jgi:hypothetical protein